MIVISRCLATFVLHGFDFCPGRMGENHSEILAYRCLFSHNVYLRFMSLTSRRTTREICMYSIYVSIWVRLRPPFESRTSSRDSLPFVSTCIIDGNESSQLVAFVVFRLKRLDSVFARNERFVNTPLIHIDLMLINL